MSISQLQDMIEEELSQGDIIVGYESIKLLKFDDSVKGLMILNYSCDLNNNGDLRTIILAPIAGIEIILDEFISGLREKLKESITETSKFSESSFRKKIKKAIQDRMLQLTKFEGHSFFLLYPDDKFIDEYSIVDITNLINVGAEEIENISKFRKASLKHPWREKLGYMLGNLFNRIALDDELNQDDQNVVKENASTLMENQINDAVEFLKTYSIGKKKMSS